MNSPHPGCFSRRHFVSRGAFGLGGFGLAWLLKQDGLLGAPEKPMLETPHYDLLPKKPHFAPRATAMISMFMQGGPSHIDLFDPKPELDKLDGKKFPGEVKYDDAANASTKVMASPWKFQKHGQCGTEVSELLPNFAGIVDDVVVLRGMQTGVNNHGQSIYALQNGRTVAGRPTIGSWLTYALGSESQELPAYVALTDPRGMPAVGLDYSGRGWQPSTHHGTAVRGEAPRRHNHAAARPLDREALTNYLDILDKLERAHLEQHTGQTGLQALYAD